MFQHRTFSYKQLRIIFIVLLLQGCADKVVPLSPLSADATIVAFGNSLTFGTGAKPEQSYPSRLSSLVQREVINAGIPGEVSADGLNRIESVLDEHKPDLLLLCHGGNDLLRKKPKTSTKSNIMQMVRLAQKRGIQVVLLGVPEPQIFSLKSADYYYEIAQEMQLPIEADILAHVLGDNQLKSDAIHPNAEGYQKIAQSIEKLLQKSGAL